MRDSVRMAIVLALLAAVGFLGGPALGDIPPYYASYPSEYINKNGWLVIISPLDRYNYKRNMRSHRDEWHNPANHNQYIPEKNNMVKSGFAFKFYDGIAPVRINKKWGYIDTTGKFIIKPQFKLVGSWDCSFEPIYKCNDPGYFHEGLAAAAPENGYFGFIDKTGKFVIKPQFVEVLPFSEGLAAVCKNISGHRKCGYIDKTGKIVIKLQYDNAGQFVNGIAEIKREPSFLYYLFGGKRVNIWGEEERRPPFEPLTWLVLVIVIWAAIAIRKARGK